MLDANFMQWFEEIKNKKPDQEALIYAEKLLTNSQDDFKKKACQETCKRCPITSRKSSMYVFMSCSMPDKAWEEMAQAARKYHAQLVIRGLPENDFMVLFDKIKHIDVDIIVDPDLFEVYGITEVPTFVVLKKDGYDKVSGNVSIEEVFQVMA